MGDTAKLDGIISKLLAARDSAPATATAPQPAVLYCINCLPALP